MIRVNHPWLDEMRFKLNLNHLVVQAMRAGEAKDPDQAAGPWICPACGARNGSGADKFCAFCGAARQ